MTAEFTDIKDFLAKYPPFNALPEDALNEAASQISLQIFPKGSQILTYGEPIRALYIVRSGIIEVYRRQGELYNRLAEGKLFGQLGLLMNGTVRFPAKAIENSEIYCLPEAVFTILCQQFDDFADFMEVDDSTRLHNAIESIQDRNNLTSAKVTSLLQRSPAKLSPTATVQQAAQTLSNENLSALLITNIDETHRASDQIIGIITEHDLSSQVLAAGLSPETPVSAVMTSDVMTLDHNTYLFEAVLTMLRHNYHHLPVMRHKRPLGIIGLTDIVRYESQHSLLLVSSIFKQNTVQDLQTLSEGVKACFQRMVNEDANSHMIGSAMAVIGRSFKQRLLELAEEKIGPPPVPYCFLALGSMARDEQLVVTDQDNALILDNAYQPQKHEPYFEALAKFVCDGLAKCGYKYCSGNIMASNPEWRKTERGWQDCFADWIDNPQPQTLLNSSIFFDLDGVGGSTEWAEKLTAFIVSRASQSRRFLACLARNALSRKPPLGFFRNFVMEKDGRQKNSINLKRRGTAPLADLIRVHSLAAGSLAQNSFERLDDVIDAGLLPQGRGPDLRDAMEFISKVRIRHQALNIAANREPDNNIEPENLSDFESRHLKDAFQILSNAQNYLKYRYHAGAINN